MTRPHSHIPICRSDDTLIKVAETINQFSKGFAMVVDPSGKLCGVVTDGDFRRLLLNHCDLNASIGQYLNRNFVYAHQNETSEQMLKKTSGSIHFLPVVDDNFHLVDYFECVQALHVPVAEPYLRGNEFKYLSDAFLSSWISSAGEYIPRFESDFSKFCQCEHGVAVSNGTVALHLALVALGIGKGDEVIVPDLTFAATANAVFHAGATPVIVDIEPDSWGIDPKQFERAITTRTKAVIPVHLYGQPCDMRAIMKIARKHKLYVIEDCAEAHGATVDGQRVGSIGDIGCFSFFGNKVLTTGEGGMCVTHRADLDEKMRILRDHGMSKTRRYWHECVGYNYRMTNLQAAIGVAQLENISNNLEKRREIERSYRNRLENGGLLTFQREDLPGRKKITWLVSALVSPNLERQFSQSLAEKGVDFRRFFVPLSQMPPYKGHVHSRGVSSDISARGINLPTLLGHPLEPILNAIEEIEGSLKPLLRKIA